MTSTGSKEEAADILKSTLPLLSRYHIPASPPNYAVWYEYVAGGNTELKSAIDALIGSGKSITDELTRELFQRYVMAPAQRRLGKARAGLQRVVESITASASCAGERVGQFNDVLADHADELEHASERDDLPGILRRLVEETDAVRESGSQLRDCLETSRRETEALREELSEARREAVTDPLTGLSNRKAFFRSLSDLTQACAIDGVCLLFIDIDRFKRINDQYGHPLGDKVLNYIATIMRKCVKGQDVVARYGGEEFAVLFPRTRLDGARAAAEQIRAAVERGRLVRSDTREPIGAVTVSVGVAAFRIGEDLDDFIARADAALYRSKETGRNKVTTEDC